MTDRKQSKEEIDVLNRVTLFCAATNSVTSAWLLPLYHPDFEREFEVRDRIFCLLISGLTDSAYEYKTRVNDLKIRAKKINSISCLYYLDMFEAYTALIIDLLEQIPREEMIALIELRNQWLHGNWTEAHKEKRTVYFAKDAKLVKEKITAAEYAEIIRSVFSRPKDFLTELRDRICNYRTFFWANDRTLGNPEIFAPIHQDLMLHSDFKGPRIVLEIAAPNFKPKPEENNRRFLSLYEMGKILLAKLEPRE